MKRLSTAKIRTWITVVAVLAIAGAVVVWMVRRDTFPRTVRMATGERGGLYYKVAASIDESLRSRTSRDLQKQTTQGSEANFQLLLDRQVELAIVQGGAVPLEELNVVTPLFPELVFIIVRKSSDIHYISELQGKNIALGKVGSGNRKSALQLLKHFGVATGDLEKSSVYFKTMLEDETIDAAIVTAGVEHPDLQEVLATHDFDLLPVPSAAALEMSHPFLQRVEIPQGLFAEDPPVPAEAIPTVATTAFVVVQPDAPDALVQAVLEAIHEDSLRLKIPTLIARRDAPQWVSTRMHPVAQRYFHPSDQIGFTANVMEALAATKELLFALGAGIYLLWIQWRRLKEQEAQAIISQQKERLDVLLEKTLTIERAQMNVNDPQQLEKYLAEVTKIKLTALHEFTEEELRGDQAFSIFLDQCSSLINKMQLKLIVARGGNSTSREDA